MQIVDHKQKKDYNIKTKRLTVPISIGPWRSGLSRWLWEPEVVGSNPTGPIKMRM